jgi:hypothetical protein
MKFILLVYNDRELLGQMSQEQFDADMRDCFTHADELAATGTLLESQQLEDPGTARTVRVRNGRRTIVDGPFAESKEVLGGFNIIEAESMEEALRLAGEFPWVRTGSVEVRPVRDIQAVRTRVAIDAAVASPSKR